MPTIRGITTFFGFDSDQNALGKINTGIEATKANAVAATAGVETLRGAVTSAVGWLTRLAAVYLGFGAVKSTIVDFTTDAAAIGKTSTALGISAEMYQVYRQAARDAGVEGDTFNAVLGKVGARASQAAAGNAEMAATFAKLGVSVKGADGKVASLDVVLARTVDAFAKMPSGPERSALAMKLFEEQGSKLLPFLSKGSKGVEELRQKMIKAGVIIGPEAIANSTKFREAYKGIGMALTGVRNTIATAILPTITKAIQAFQKWLSTSVGLKRMVEIFRGIATAAALAFGAFIVGKILLAVGAVWKAVAALRAMGAAAALTSAAVAIIPLAIFALILLIDDLYHFWKGDQDTLVGKMLGEGAQKKLLSFLSTVDTVFTFIKDAIKWIGTTAPKAIGAAWDWVIDIPNKILTGFQKLWAWFATPFDAKGGFLGWLLNMLKAIGKLIRAVVSGVKKMKELLFGKEAEGAALTPGLAAGMAGPEPEFGPLALTPRELAGMGPQYGPLALTPRELAGMGPQYGPLALTESEKAVQNIRQVFPTFSPTIVVNAKTDATPEAIAEEARRVFKGEIKSAYDAIVSPAAGYL